MFNFYLIGKKKYAINLSKNFFFEYNETTNELTKTTTPIKSQSLDYHRLYTTNNRLWIASGIGGVQLFDKHLIQLFINEKLFDDFFISHVYQDLEGNILLSTFDRGVLVIPTPTMLYFKEEKGELTTCILSDEKQQLFIGTNKSVVKQKTKNNYTTLSSSGNKSIDALYKWTNTPFLLTDQLGLTITNTQTKKNKVFKNFAFKCAVLSKSNKLYIGTNIGVWTVNYNQTTDEFIFEKDSLITERIYSIASDPQSDYIYCTTSNGLKIKSPFGSVHTLKINDSIVYGTAMCSSNNGT